MVSATLVDNSSFTQAATTGQLAWTAGNTITVHNSLFTDLSLGSRACAGPLPASFSFSIWRGTSCGNSTANGNQPSTWAIVARIGRSCGGLAPDLTPTHRALYSDAESIDTGSCRIGDPMTDQRGVARAQGIACDVGATEFLPACDQPLFSDDFEIASTQNWSLTVP